MLVTTVLLYVVMTRIWKWRLWVAISLTVLFAFIDIGFFASNIVKVFEGGWASLLVAFTIVLGMWTWVRGSRYLFDKTRRNEIPLDFLAGNLLKKKPQLVSGTAVFLTSDPLSAPTALMHSLKHYKVLHEDDLIIPAREGALRVLRAARDAGVKRVVLTSSFAAIGYGKMPPDGRPFTEESWTDPTAKVSAYVKSKTLAERAAWDFVATEGGRLELAVVNPVGIFGPVLGSEHSSSTEFVQRMFEN